MRDKDDRNWVKALVVPNKYVLLSTVNFYIDSLIILVMLLDARAE